MTVLITLTLAGSDTGPFSLYSNANNFTTAFETGVSRVALVTGYTSTAVPTNTTEIMLQSVGSCNRHLYLLVDGAPTTTTTTSSTSSTTSTTTTISPGLTLAEIAFHAQSTSGCSLGTILRIFLDDVDYALFVDNGNSFAGIGGGGATTCTVIARDHLGNPITDYLLDNDSICWQLSSGNFTYNTNQC